MSRRAVIEEVSDSDSDPDIQDISTVAHINRTNSIADKDEFDSKRFFALVIDKFHLRLCPLRILLLLPASRVFFFSLSIFLPVTLKIFLEAF